MANTGMCYLRHAVRMAQFLAYDAIDETSEAAVLCAQFQYACDLMSNGLPDEGFEQFDAAFERASFHGYVVPPGVPSDAPAE